MRNYFFKVCRNLFWFAFLWTLAAFTPASAPQAVLIEDTADRNWQFIRVVDGDTLRFFAPDFPQGLKNISIRLRGIDAPERGSRAECRLEQERAEEATRFTQDFVKDGPIHLTHLSWDKYGGRIIADLDISGANLAKALLKAGLAQSYAERHSFCSPEPPK